MWVFGGAGYDGILNDFHCFDLKEKKWEQILAAGAWPPLVHGHTAVVYDGKVCIWPQFSFFSLCSRWLFLVGAQGLEMCVYILMIYGFIPLLRKRGHNMLVSETCSDHLLICDRSLGSKSLPFSCYY